ncbi:MFS family permease [Methanomicrobium sp. W14]|uniref:MFS transporter n=1 Tax=Methanomicrobium sp. W14 TaxID=2817839 RepID=UPI001AE73247|nr:MFS transporter [Methanomicrobium sp. W14]MBP2133265.1 MFS family permease [Methanomicrobium sp. W14]
MSIYPKRQPDINSVAGDKNGRGIHYKWIALSNTTIAIFMAAVNGSILLISLPAIFNGISINPLTSFQYLLWVLMGYGIVTATLLLSFGRLSDMYGRVRLYNLGFAIFTAGSVLLFLTPDTGDAGAIEIIVFRLVQAVGSAFIFSNSAAILTDAFPPDERGKALGLNQVAAISGQFVGLIIGGLLAVFNWRYVFLISVPFGIFGTVWAYLKLKEPSYRKKNTQKVDIWGNLLFICGLTVFLIGITYGLVPYGDSPMGWEDPFVITALIAGLLMLLAFPVVETRVKDPMFRVDLFKIRNFAFGNAAGFLSALARGGVMIILIILLQGVWLPLHGYSFESTPFWAGVYMLPLTIGFVLMGPVSGILSDRYGARWLSTGGMLLVGISFLVLAALPYDFDYLLFAAALLIMGLGNGMFASPNSAAIMNSVPAGDRGVSSGMMSTLMNSGFVLSMGMFFTIVVVELTKTFPSVLSSALTAVNASVLIPEMSAIPATGALFAAFLGYNPVQMILSGISPDLVAGISSATIATLTGVNWFPETLAVAFMPSLDLSFYIGAALSFIAALLCSMRGNKYIEEIDGTGYRTGSKNISNSDIK